MVVRDIERDDIEYISKTLNCLPIAHVDHMKPEKLGHAESVQEMQVVNKSLMLPNRSVTLLPYILCLISVQLDFNLVAH